MSVHSAGPNRWPRVSWHRGGAELVPFATLAAFASAAARGAELIEVDVRRTADGVLVCVHDPHVPGLGRVDELRWSEIGGGSERLFTFEHFLDTLDEHDPDRRSEVHLDLKGGGYEEAAVELVAAHSRRLVVTSGEAASISVVRASHPQVDALLTIGRDGRGLSPRELVRVRAEEMLPFANIERSGATGVAAHFLLAGPHLRRWCSRHGMQLLVWTVDDDRALRRWLRRRDVDVVTTNRPLAALAMRAGRRSEHAGRER